MIIVTDGSAKNMTKSLLAFCLEQKDFRNNHFFWEKHHAALSEKQVHQIAACALFIQ